MIRDLTKVKNKVALILEEYEASRDCDKKLWLAYLVKFHGLREFLRNSNDSYKAFSQLILDDDTPTMESIRRVRQKYQEEGKFLGTKRMKKLEEAERVREWAR